MWKMTLTHTSLSGESPKLDLVEMETTG
jgi:hypothetical protein